MPVFRTGVVLSSSLPIGAAILTRYIRSIDTEARPISYAGFGVPDELAKLVRANLDTVITI
jgi:hypothetical protein